MTCMAHIMTFILGCLGNALKMHLFLPLFLTFCPSLKCASYGSDQLLLNCDNVFLQYLNGWTGTGKGRMDGCRSCRRRCRENEHLVHLKTIPWLETSLLDRLQVQTLPDATPPIGKSTPPLQQNCCDF